MSGYCHPSATPLVFFVFSALTNLSVLMSNTINLGGQIVLNVSTLSITPLSSTHSLLHLSALTLNTDTRAEQLGFGDVTKSPLDASLCHSQLG